MAFILFCLAPGLIEAQSVRLTWNPNPEPDIAGYLLFYGTQSGNLTQYRDVGKVTTATIGPLQPSTTYHFAVQAYNTSGLFSELSDEIAHTTPEPAPTGLAIRNESGKLLAKQGAIMDFGVVRLGAMGDTRTFTLTNHGTAPVSGICWFTDVPGSEHFIVHNMPVVALANPNGSFEKGFEGWTTSGQVRFRAHSGATHGSNLVDFSFGESANNGVLRTTFPTMPGKQYQLQFDLGLRCYFTNPQTMSTTVRGANTLLTDVSSIKGPGGDVMVWEAKSFRFTADSTTTSLVFEDISTTTAGLDLMLDHVRVIDIAASRMLGGITLEPGKSLPFSLKFQPGKAGVHASQFRLTRDGEKLDVYDFTVRAAGSVSYDSWLETAALGGSPGGTTGASPVPPLHQFAFGMEPGQAGGQLAFENGRVVSRGTPAIRMSSTAGKPVDGLFARRKDRGIVGLAYRPQFSADLIRWLDVTDEPVIVADDGEIEIVGVTAPENIDDKPARFFRVGIEQVALPSGYDFVEWLDYHQAADVSPGSAGTQELTGMLMEYAFGLMPGSGPGGAVAESGGIIVSRGQPNVRPPAVPGDSFKGIFARRKNHADVGLSYRPQFSADLIHWHDSTAVPSVLADDGEMQVVSVSAPALLDGMPARFFRVGVNGPIPEPPAPLAFDAWVEDQAADQPPDEHHLMAYAFGLDAAQAASRRLLTVEGNAVSRGLPNASPPAGPEQLFKGIFSRRKAHADVGLSYRPQFSADLVHWHDATAAPVVIAEDGEIEVVSVSAPQELDGKPARFFRVGITLAPGM